MALVATGLAASTRSSAAEEAHDVVLFRASSSRSGDLTLDERKLQAAVRIYTRDLGVQLRSDEPAGAHAADDPPPRLTFWYRALATPDDAVAITLFVQGPASEAVAAPGPSATSAPASPSGPSATSAPVPRPAATPSTPPGPQILELRGTLDGNLYRAIALKVRAVLTGAAAAELRATPATESGPTPPISQPPPQPAVLSPAPAAATAATATASLVVPRAPRRVRLGVDALAHLVLSDGTTVARAGGSVTLTVAPAAIVELALGFAADDAQRYSSSAGATGARVAAAARVYPIFVGVRLLGRRGRWSGGGGLRGGIAVVTADAQLAGESSADRTATRVSGLVGAEAIVRLHLLPWLAVIGQAAGDVLVQRVRFDQGTAPLLDAGRYLGRVGLGFSLTVP